MRMNIIPAVGWSALYKIGDSMIAKPLVCWGAVEDQTGAYITGFVVDDSNDIVNAKNQIGFSTFEFDIDSANVDYMALKNE